MQSRMSVPALQHVHLSAADMPWAGLRRCGFKMGGGF